MPSPKAKTQVVIVAPPTAVDALPSKTMVQAAAGGCVGHPAPAAATAVNDGVGLIEPGPTVIGFVTDADLPRSLVTVNVTLKVCAIPKSC